MRLALLALLLAAAPVSAGLHYSGEALRPLPAEWRGFLPDQRLLRQAAAEPGGPLRERYVAAKLALESLGRPLTADEAADLGALFVRIGEPTAAVKVLRPAARVSPEHFRLAANLGTAWQAAGDLAQAALALEEAVRLAPAEHKPAETLHLRLVRKRLAEQKAGGKPVALDDLFGVNYAALTAAERAKLPAEALALTQRLAASLPADGRLLWQLGELAHADGDVRAAARILDGCVTELGVQSPELAARRQAYKAAADALDQAAAGGIAAKPAVQKVAGFRSPRLFVRTVDVSKLPAIKPDGVNALPWSVVGETEVDRKGRATVLDYLGQLDGRRVTLSGFASPLGGAAAAEMESFALTENPVGCWYCETPGPSQMVVVEMAAETTLEPTRQGVRLTGRVRLNRTDPERYPVTIVDARVVPAD